MMEQPTESPDDPWGEPRRREISWHDPLAVLAAARDLSGFEYLTAMLEGRLPGPPIAHTLGFTLTKVTEGEAWFSWWRPPAAAA